jgi:hypothetical protein
MKDEDKQDHEQLMTKFGKINFGHALKWARHMPEDEEQWDELCKVSPVPTMCIAIHQAADFLESLYPGFIDDVIKHSDEDENGHECEIGEVVKMPIDRTLQ